MNVYVWERIEHCSDNYHSDGGLVVFANDEKRARELANSTPGCSLLDTELPDLVAGAEADVSEKVFVFPDAGCC